MVPAYAEQASIAGTYEIIVCSGSCSFASHANAFARGLLVLQNGPLPQASVARIGRLRADRGGEITNACFSGVKFRESQSYVFNTRHGAMTWERQDRTIRFSLYRSADAGYSVELQSNGHELSGAGRSWIVFEPPPQLPTDVVVARRIGPPHLAACQ
jgi:hypothetical protein